MECNTDGSITLVKELGKDFVIPKKKPEEKMENAIAQSNDAIAQQSVMQNSYPQAYDYSQYYNNPEMYQQYLQYQQYWANQQQQTYNNYTSNPQEPQQYPNRGLKRPANNNEKAKNQDLKTKYKYSFTDLYDPTLPEELRKLLQPLYCQLCCSTLNSNLNARMHYSSKNHNKKIKKWLTDHSAQTGEPLHKRALLDEMRKEVTENDRRYFHCDVCDLPLTGRVHAEQHYCGKSHQKALTGRRAPSGKGCYNADGKWIRTVAAQSDTTGRDGFGQAFILAPPEASASVVPNFDATGSISSMLHCEVCNISVTSLGQMEVHRVGHKHQKKLKQLSTTKTAAPHSAVVPQYQDALVPVAGDVGYYGSTIGSTIIPTTENGVFDEEYLARFRTPSGQYYCKTCDTSVNSESQFGIHMQSKKHQKKVNTPKT